MNDKKQDNFFPPQDGRVIDNQSTKLYEGKPLPEWLQQPVAEQQWSATTSQQNEEKAAVPDWVLKPVNF